ncbi:CIC11C00000002778 [Sungouiella intermedia]|uniref:CIC11C00000002778 n=1 Tax=Sungouiella intermedia TaxID=45354 RepID=A0A1L0BAD8_9ASCO|nr:CIC11C00000002778 [[Candida] intermedia]
MHPRVNELLPLSSNSGTSALLQDIQRFEDDDDEEDPNDERILPQGISMDRYTEFGTADDVNYPQMYTALSYSMLRERSTSLMTQNAPHLQHAQRTHLASMSELDNVYQREAAGKRLRVDEINNDRKRRQLEFEPVASYLEQRWQDGIRLMTDLGIQRAQE